MKILVVRYRFIGDMILTVPFLRNLRRAYPEAQIDMLVSPNSGEVIEDCTYVDNFIYYDETRKHLYENGIGKKKSFWDYVFLLRKEKYDKAYILKRSLSSALLCFYCGIKERIGFDTEGRGFLLTKRVKYDLDKHESECCLDVLRADGINVVDNYLESRINKESEKKVKLLFEENGINDKEIKVVVNATATNELKVWGINRFIEVVEYLSNVKNARVIFIGALSNKQLYDELKYNIGLKKKPVNLCGQLSLKDSLVVIKYSDLLIGNDSGNLHMAASVGTKVIGLFGPMSVKKWKPLGEGHILLKADLPCIPCLLKKKCKYNKACMNAITVEQVEKAIDSIL